LITTELPGHRGRKREVKTGGRSPRPKAHGRGGRGGEPVPSSVKKPGHKERRKKRKKASKEPQRKGTWVAGEGNFSTSKKEKGGGSATPRGLGRRTNKQLRRRGLEGEESRNKSRRGGSPGPSKKNFSVCGRRKGNLCFRPSTTSEGIQRHYAEEPSPGKRGRLHFVKNDRAGELQMAAERCCPAVWDTKIPL